MVKTWFSCLCSLNNQDMPFYFCSLKRLSLTTQQIMFSFAYLLKYHDHMATNPQRTPVRFLPFWPPFIYCLFMELYVHIFSVGTCWCIFPNTSCMFIMYVLNVLKCVNKLFLSFLLSLQCLYIIGYTHANIEPCSVGTQLNSNNQHNGSYWYQ